MIMLILGLMLFCAVHFVPSLAPQLKSALHGKLGEGGYKGTFSLLLMLSFGLMIMGWRSAQPELVYLPPVSLRHPAMLLVVVAFFLLAISNRPSGLRRWIRHPQLTGVMMWAIAHLLMNGDSRSVVLFGGMALWSLIEIIAINRREGAWIKDPAPPLSTDLISVAITAVVVAIVIAIHPYLSGMPVM
ncbi:MAG: NnrU family protein [Halioglobus sp.]